MREMKDSGIEWIGQIPKDWERARLKDYFCFEKGKNAQMYTIEYIGRNEGIYPVYSGQTENDGVMGKINQYDYDVDECLFTTTVGAKAMTPKYLTGKFCLSQNCLIMQPTKDSSVKYFYYMLHPLFDYQKSNIPAYMQPSLRMEDLEKMVCCLPNLMNQKIIADFLDTQCSEIDATAEDIQKEISLLEEYKKSLVYNVISNGINHSIYSTENDEVWGNLPQGWKLVDIKYLFEIVKRIAGKEGYDVLSVTQKGLKIKDITSGDGQLADNYCGYQFVYPTDYVMNHMDLLTGWVDCSELFGVTSPDYRVFRLIDRSAHNLVYYKYVMQCCYMNKIFYSLGQGVSNLGRWRLQTSSFNNFKVPVPPKDEQDEIADYLDSKCSEIDAIIADKKRQLDILDDYKKSLIYEYVTGKKEVPINE